MVMQPLPDDSWSPQGDPMLALLPVEKPAIFKDLPLDEQKWRGRLFLITYITTGSVAFAWYSALTEDPDHVREMQLHIAATPDEVIVRGLQAKADIDTATAQAQAGEQ
jgi:hypothetical protein